jgi:hypothetical protein
MVQMEKTQMEEMTKMETQKSHNKGQVVEQFLLPIYLLLMMILL